MWDRLFGFLTKADKIWLAIFTLEISLFCNGVLPDDTSGIGRGMALLVTVLFIAWSTFNVVDGTVRRKIGLAVAIAIVTVVIGLAVMTSTAGLLWGLEYCLRGPGPISPLSNFINDLFYFWALGWVWLLAQRPDGIKRLFDTK